MLIRQKKKEERKTLIVYEKDQVCPAKYILEGMPFMSNEHAQKWKQSDCEIYLKKKKLVLVSLTSSVTLD